MTLALALLADQVAALPRPQAIFGGTPTASCEWPSVVRVGECSGVLVAPEIVVTAGHCEDADEVAFGVDEDTAERVATVGCGDTGHQVPGEGLDLGWCRLAQPRDDLPIIAPLMGDEAAVLRPGRPVRIVGFGLTEDGDFGVQHLVETTLVEIDGDYVFLGGDGRDTCFGDSGAPAFVTLDDGSLRAFGITSYGASPCGQGGWYTLLAAGMPWLESATGADLTPCRDADGRRAKGEHCLPPAASDCMAGEHQAGAAPSGCATAAPSNVAAAAVGLVVLLGRRRRRLSRASAAARVPEPARRRRPLR